MAYYYRQLRMALSGARITGQSERFMIDFVVDPDRRMPEDEFQHHRRVFAQELRDLGIRSVVQARSVLDMDDVHQYMQMYGVRFQSLEVASVDDAELDMLYKTSRYSIQGLMPAKLIDSPYRDTLPEWRRGPVRGPNFLRNQANRMKKKIQKEQRRSDAVAGDPDSELERKARRLRLQRQCMQEQRKLDKLNSPLQMLEDAMKMVRQAEECAKRANDSKVARWAADLSTASAESIARSAGGLSSGVGRVDTVSSSSATSQSVRREKPKELPVYKDFSVQSVPMVAVERIACERGVLTVEQLEVARERARRVLHVGDFLTKDCPYKMTLRQRDAILDWDVEK